MKFQKAHVCNQKNSTHSRAVFLVLLLSLAQVNISTLSLNDNLAVANDVDATWQLLESVGGLDILLE